MCIIYNLRYFLIINCKYKLNVCINCHNLMTKTKLLAVSTNIDVDVINDNFFIYWIFWAFKTFCIG